MRITGHLVRKRQSGYRPTTALRAVAHASPLRSTATTVAASYRHPRRRHCVPLADGPTPIRSGGPDIDDDDPPVFRSVRPLWICRLGKSLADRLQLVG